MTASASKWNLDCVSRNILYRCSVGMVFLLLLCGRVFAEAPINEASTVVVVYNATDSLSRDLANDYAKMRGIDPSHLIGISAPATETISRSDFNLTIAEPLRDRFIQKGWWRVQKAPDGIREVISSTIRYVVLMRGVPLKIKHDPSYLPENLPLPDNIKNHNEASVDSEIAVLANFGRSISGFIPNPYFKKEGRILSQPKEFTLLLVTRLDAPTAGDVERMIKDSIETEKIGLWGWAYIDLRGVAAGGYQEGDQWLKNLTGEMLAQGLPVIHEHLPETLPTAYPVTDAAIYYGWYAPQINGPFASETFRFRPGAIAVHIHSFSAASLRSTTSGWTAPLIAHGAAASLGNVYEPYLSLTTHLDIFQNRLMRGFNLAESAYMATPALSWMGVVVGDPLYRPYAAWKKEIGTQASSIDVWQTYRRIVQQANGNLPTLSSSLKQEALSTKNAFFFEALGQTQSYEENYNAAFASFSMGRKLATSDAEKLRLILSQILMRHYQGRMQEADEISAQAVSLFPSAEIQSLLLRWTKPPPPPPSASPSQRNSPAVKPTKTTHPSGMDRLKPKPPRPPGAP